MIFVCQHSTYPLFNCNFCDLASLTCVSPETHLPLQQMQGLLLVQRDPTHNSNTDWPHMFTLNVWLSDRRNPISAEQFGYNHTIINDQEYMALLKECFWLGFLPKGSAFGRNGSSQKPNLLGGTLVLPNIRFGRTFGSVRFSFCRTCSGFGRSLM